ncbi:phage scaffolding protein [Brevibacillus laterosporus]|uniref:Phage scaffolding protein n=1 Tax=Brevibacillus laterosporus TaxID=1465 RepID=A0AAP3GAC3_BRELA|nr:phage scaffolding protein [Brevibacillus laterosporus]MCR8983267.1 phage scaffolding protein [Brevibacillus laterosporus]MCZ0810423.1 phage scaffolding protein [Brevibacillus laterosporus]MCZ0829004.1 phage scaffolding protein [Brevibacillus laterosporus]MCZ0853055.1 phage scaffolding protein [Brevibacillus laterosporus]
MDWLKKLLQELGISEEHIEKITGGVEENYKGYVPKHRFDEINDTKKELEGQIKDRDKQLTELKKNTGDNEDLKKQIETLQAENKTKGEEYETKLKDMQVSTAIKLALTGEAHDPDLIASLLDKSKIEINEDGTLKGGLDDQVKALRESKAFLFVEKQQEEHKPTFKGATPADGSGRQTDPATNSAGANFAKQANQAGKPAENNIWG